MPPRPARPAGGGARPVARWRRRGGPGGPGGGARGGPGGGVRGGPVAAAVAAVPRWSRRRRRRWRWRRGGPRRRWRAAAGGGGFRGGGGRPGSGGGRGGAAGAFGRPGGPSRRVASPRGSAPGVSTTCRRPASAAFACPGQRRDDPAAARRLADRLRRQDQRQPGLAGAGAVPPRRDGHRDPVGLRRHPGAARHRDGLQGAGRLPRTRRTASCSTRSTSPTARTRAARRTCSPAAGRDRHGSRRPRQDPPAGRDPQDQRARGRGRRHHPAHRRLPGRGRRWTATSG